MPSVTKASSKTRSPSFVSAFISSFYDMKSRISAAPNSRFLSWEYCYKEFSDAFGRLSSLSNDDYLRLSLYLAFYLASWGMYRGSSFLLQYDYTIHIDAVKMILQEKYRPLLGIYWNNRAPDYQNLLDLLFELIDGLKGIYRSLRGPTVTIDVSDTLITKILLGTLGCVPAYDKNVKAALSKGKSSRYQFIQAFSRKSLERLVKFWMDYEADLSPLTSSIKLKSDPSINYPQMKIVDMALWNL